MLRVRTIGVPRGRGALQGSRHIAGILLCVGSAIARAVCWIHCWVVRTHAVIHAIDAKEVTNKETPRVSVARIRQEGEELVNGVITDGM